MTPKQQQQDEMHALRRLRDNVYLTTKIFDNKFVSGKLAVSGQAYEQISDMFAKIAAILYEEQNRLAKEVDL